MKKLLFKRISLNDNFRNHNKICLDIEIYNKYWKMVYFNFIYLLIPINSLVLNLIFFEDSIILSKLVYMTFAMTTIASMFCINLIISDIHFKISNTYDKLYGYYIRTNHILSICNRYKVCYII